jgi:hypothetical protein
MKQPTHSTAVVQRQLDADNGRDIDGRIQSASARMGKTCPAGGASAA